MRNYVLKRLLLTIPTLLGITFITFLVIHIAPGEPPAIARGLGQLRSQSAIDEVSLKKWKELHNLDKPLNVQYWLWLKRLFPYGHTKVGNTSVRRFTPDFGKSFKDGRSVTEKIKERLPVTLRLNLITLFLIYIIAIPLGIRSAVKQGKPSDRIITFILFVLYSLPGFWVAHMLITYVSGGDYLNLFPLAGVESWTIDQMSLSERFFDRVWHYVLPVLVLSYPALAGLSRYARVGMLEVIRQDYIRTARAKGLPEKVVIMKHAFRNSMITIVTLIGALLPSLLGGSVIVEQIFSIPGLGRLGFEAVMTRDFPQIMATATIGAVLTLIGILISDLLYGLVDPRISYETASPWQGLVGIYGKTVDEFKKRPLLTTTTVMAGAGLIILLCTYHLMPIGQVIGVLTLEAIIIPFLFSSYLNKSFLKILIGGVIIPIIIGLFLWLLLRFKATVLGMSAFTFAFVVMGVTFFIFIAFFVFKGISVNFDIVVRQFRKNKLAVLSLFIILLLVVVAIIAPLLAFDRPIVMKFDGHVYFPAIRTNSRIRILDFEKLKEDIGEGNWAIWPPIRYGPNETNLDDFLQEPSKKHLLGTDELGRDILARIIHGSRISLAVGFIAVGIYIIIGVVMGSLAGFYRGGADILISRLIEIQICFPSFFLILTLIALLPQSIFNIMIVIGITGWPGIARLIRGEFLKQRENEYVLAAKALGTPNRTIIFSHVLPNAIAPVLVAATFGIAAAILVESSLSYLGFGVPPPTASWGSILAGSREYVSLAWWMVWPPGIAIFSTIIAYNFVGESLRDAIDPRLKT